MSERPSPMRGLRGRIIAWSFVPTALVLFAVALVSFFAYRSVTEQLVVERNRELGRLSAGQLASGLTGFIDLLESVARMPDMARGVPVGQQAALTWARDKQSVFDGGIVILDAWGTVVAAAPERPKALGQDWSGRSYFGQMLRNPGPVISGMVPDGIDGVPVVVLAAPIVGDGGQLRGAILGMFNVRPTAVSSFYGEIVKLRHEIRLGPVDRYPNAEGIETDWTQEVMQDVDLLALEPDPKSRMGASRFIGHSRSAGRVIVVIAYRDLDGDLHGINAWPATGADLTLYQQGDDDGQDD